MNIVTVREPKVNSLVMISSSPPTLLTLKSPMKPGSNKVLDLSQDGFTAENNYIKPIFPRWKKYGLLQYYKCHSSTIFSSAIISQISSLCQVSGSTWYISPLLQSTDALCRFTIQWTQNSIQCPTLRSSNMCLRCLQSDLTRGRQRHCHNWMISS